MTCGSLEERIKRKHDTTCSLADERKTRHQDTANKETQGTSKH